MPNITPNVGMAVDDIEITPAHVTVTENLNVAMNLESAGSGGGLVNSVDGKIGDVEVLPTGGTAGQVLKKASEADYDVEWADESGGTGISGALKQALLQIAQKAVYIDDGGPNYYAALYAALYTVTAITLDVDTLSLNTGETQQINAVTTPAGGLVSWSSSDDAVATVSDAGLVTATGAGSATITASSGSVSASCAVTVSAVELVSISASYVQSGTVYDTDTLDSLKTDLVVTAHYSDSSTQTVPAADYVLSGTLEVGTSTITVTYGGKTTTFNVTVTEAPSVLTGYTEVGSPTITDNILTVADGKFIKSNAEFSPGDSSWRITCKYRNTSGAYASYTDILGSVDSSNASYRSILLESTSSTGGAISMYLSSNGTSWDIGSGNSTQATNIPHGQGVWVWLDFSFDGSSYILKYSDDGETFTTGKTWANTGKVIGGYSVGFGMKRNGYLQGEIDLSECKIWIDGDLYWSAV